MATASESFFRRLERGLENRTVRQTVGRVQDHFKSVRAKAFDDLGDVGRWRRHAEAVRQHTMENLDAFLEQFADRVRANGGHVHFAADAREACDYVVRVAQRHGVRRVVKGKSMVTEEIHLNDALQGAGIEVTETDLGEFILQLAKERPFHIVGPAIHKNREQIAALFSELAGEALPPHPETLTRFAREFLRDKFFQADMGVTGCNFAIAESGSVVLFSNEGNIRMATTLPPVHVVVMGMERVVPTWEDLDALLTLLPRSTTGQKTSSYISAVTGPRRAGEADGPEEWHVVIVDNGRSHLLGTRYQKALHCIRCGTCSLVCPVYRHIGGHAYGSVYNGPIGSVITPLMNLAAGGQELPFASSLCGACSEACPVNIPLHEYLVELRADLSTQAGWAERTVARLFGWGTARAPVYRLGQRMIGWLAGGGAEDGYVTAARGPLGLWTAYRDLPRPAQETFLQWWKRRAGSTPADEGRREDAAAVVRGARAAEEGEGHERGAKPHMAVVGMTAKGTVGEKGSAEDATAAAAVSAATAAGSAMAETGSAMEGSGPAAPGAEDGRQAAFLEKLAERLGRPRRRKGDVGPPKFTSRPWDDFYYGKTQGDWIDLFCQTLEAQGGQVWRVKTHEEWRARLAQWLREKGVRQAVLARDARLQGLGLTELLEEASVTWFVWQGDGNGTDDGQEGRRWIDAAKGAQVGITWADVALAQTGTVVQFSSPGTGRSVSLLPEVHLVFLFGRDIRGRLSDLTRLLSRMHEEGRIPSSVNLIGGPSSSADIEMKIVKGVHGPRELVAVVLDWEERVDGGDGV